MHRIDQLSGLISGSEPNSAKLDQLDAAWRIVDFEINHRLVLKRWCGWSQQAGWSAIYSPVRGHF